MTLQDTDHMTVDYSRWFNYRIDERHAPWKVFFPVSSKASILAISLNGSNLASLARSYKNIYLFKCAEDEIEWARKDGLSLGLTYNFIILDKLDSQATFQAIAISSRLAPIADTERISRLLEPGGIAVWVGFRKHNPFMKDLYNYGYEKISTYALLPPGTGKIMVPTNNPISSRLGLNLFKPYKLRNQLAIKAGVYLTYWKMQRLLSPKEILVARRPGKNVNDVSLYSFLNEKYDERIMDVAIYCGWTKLLVQLQTCDGNIDGIAKIADMALGIKSIERESKTLEYIDKLPELRQSVPSINGVERIESYTIQYQTVAVKPSMKYCNRLTKPHIRFLKALSHVDRNDIFIDQWPAWPSLLEWVNKFESVSPTIAKPLRDTLKSTADKLSGIKIPFHRVHGDFAPRHTLLSNDDLVVIDWEDSVNIGLPLYDAVHFLLQPYFLVQQKSVNIQHILAYPQHLINIMDYHDKLSTSVPMATDIVRLAIIWAYRINVNPWLRCEEDI